MNWDAIGAVGEITGAIAVVATLAYLALQVRFAKTVAAESNRLTRATGVRDALLAQATNDELRNSMTRTYGLQAWYEQFGQAFDVSADDAGRADAMHLYWFWVHWAQWAATNDERGYAELTHIIRSFYSTPAIRYSWDHAPFAKPILEPGFVEFVEAALAADQNA